MKIKVKVEKIEEFEFPDHFLDDMSLRGKLVDLLLEELAGRHDTFRDRVRWAVYEVDVPTPCSKAASGPITANIHVIREAYERADKILTLLRGKPL